MAEIIKSIDENGNSVFDVTPEENEDQIALATANTYVDKNIIFNIIGGEGEHTYATEAEIIALFDDIIIPEILNFNYTNFSYTGPDPMIIGQLHPGDEYKRINIYATIDLNTLTNGSGGATPSILYVGTSPEDFRQGYGFSVRVNTTTNEMYGNYTCGDSYSDVSGRKMTYTPSADNKLKFAISYIYGCAYIWLGDSNLQVDFNNLDSRFIDYGYMTEYINPYFKDSANADIPIYVSIGTNERTPMNVTFTELVGYLE